MLEEARLEKNKTGGDHYVLSVIVQRTPVRINLFGGETVEDVDCFIRDRMAALWDSHSTDLKAVSEQVVATEFESEKVEKFNSRWRVHCLKEQMDSVNMKDKISYDEALQALREYFIVEPVLES